MNRYRFALVLLSTLVLASAAGTGSPVDNPSAGSFCDKLCTIGEHCVPTPSGGVCVPGYAETGAVCTDSTGLIARGAFCDKLCVIGEHCVPTPSGGICVPGYAEVEATPADPADEPAAKL